MEIYPHLPSREDVLPSLMQTEPQLQKIPNLVLSRCRLPSQVGMCPFILFLSWTELLVGLVEDLRSILSLNRLLCLCPHNHKLRQASSIPAKHGNRLNLPVTHILKGLEQSGPHGNEARTILPAFSVSPAFYVSGTGKGRTPVLKSPPG